ncbi:MAG: hypothetical protein EPN82_07700 [Bacteroidetes bacterium]|nr:MAG: hypothetical protein EPN82_07700 [Bacteroidota bacterium]
MEIILLILVVIVFISCNENSTNNINNINYDFYVECYEYGYYSDKNDWDLNSKKLVETYYLKKIQNYKNNS